MSGLRNASPNQADIVPHSLTLMHVGDTGGSNPSQTERRFWVPSQGKDLHLLVTASNIGGLIDRNMESGFKHLYHASFEIKEFDAGVRERFAELCQYVRKLKISFRSRGTNTRPYLDLDFNRLVIRTLDILRTAPQLSSLYLDFHTDGTTTPWVPRIGMWVAVAGALARLKEAPKLSRLYVDLTSNNIHSAHVQELIGLYESQTIHTLSLTLAGNRGITEHCVLALSNLENATTLRTFHLDLFGDYPNVRRLTDPGLKQVCKNIMRSPCPQKLYLFGPLTACPVLWHSPL
jgi:hypothetical protein